MLTPSDMTVMPFGLLPPVVGAFRMTVVPSDAESPDTVHALPPPLILLMMISRPEFEAAAGSVNVTGAVVVSHRTTSSVPRSVWVDVAVRTASVPKPPVGPVAPVAPVAPVGP